MASSSSKAPTENEMKRIIAPVFALNGQKVVSFGGSLLPVISRPSIDNTDRLEAIWNGHVYEVRDSMNMLGNGEEEARKIMKMESLGAGCPSVDVELVHALIIQGKEIERLKSLLEESYQGMMLLKGDIENEVKIEKSEWKRGDLLSSSFVEDVTIPDGTKMKEGEEFVKRWKFKNNGNLWWPSECSFKHKSDSFLPMTSPNQKEIKIKEPVPPGATVMVSVKMKTPILSSPSTSSKSKESSSSSSSPSSYQHIISYWQFADPSGSFFGVHGFVDIQVKKGKH